MKDQACTAEDSVHLTRDKRLNVPTKHFTLQSAQVLLPELRPRLRSLRELARQLWERKREILDLWEREKSAVCRGLTPYKEELAAMLKHLNQQWERLKSEVAVIRQFGVVPRSIVDGVVDFPCVIHGRRVYLCWQVDEPTILYWHPVDAGFAERAPLHDIGSPLWDFCDRSLALVR